MPDASGLAELMGAAPTPQEHMPFTVIRSRTVAGQLGSRDEMYRPHFSQDGDVWEFTSALIEEARGTVALCHPWAARSMILDAPLVRW